MAIVVVMVAVLVVMVVVVLLSLSEVAAVAELAPYLSGSLLPFVRVQTATQTDCGLREPVG